MDYQQVILKPIITEKATALAEQGKYVFKVTSFVTKAVVKQAIEKIYKVKVTRVNFILVRSRLRRRGRIQGKSTQWKKAVVTLKKGDKIELFEGV
jgi:large subunit ribosomal protein L23